MKNSIAIAILAACICDTRGKCAGILTPDRLQILLQAYSAARLAGLHDTLQPPVQDEATEIMGLLHRVYKGLQGDGLQPENLADRLLVKHSQPASKIETNSDKNFENLHES